jgi:hypothetical protein
MNPDTVGKWAKVLIRDIATPAVGMVSFVWIVSTGKFEVWQVPLFWALILTPVVGRSDPGAGQDEDPRVPPGDGPPGEQPSIFNQDLLP